MQERNDTSIDQLFRSHLANHQISISDKEALWSRIRPERADRWPVILLWSLGVLAISGVAYWIGTSSNLHISPTPLLSDLQVTSVQPSPHGDISHTVALAFTNETTHKPKKEKLQSSRLKSQPQAAPTASAITPASSIDNNNSQKANGTISSIQNTKRLSSTTPSHDHSSFSHPITTEAINIENETAVSQDGPVHGLKILGSFAGKERATTLAIMQMPNLGVEALPISEIQMPIPSLKKEAMLACEIKKAGKLFIDIGGYVGLPLESLSMDGTSAEASTYITSWQERYDPLSTFGVNGKIGYEWPSGVSIAAGIDYQRVESQYQTTQTITETVTVLDPMAYFYYDADGNVVWVEDSVSVINVYDRQVSAPYTSTLISVPLQIGYPILKSDQWHLKATLTGSMNMTLTQRGQHLREDLAVIPLNDTNAPDYYSSSVGYTIEPGLQLGKPISEHLEWYLQPSYRYSVGNYFLGDNTITLKRDYINLQTGLIIRF